MSVAQLAVLVTALASLVASVTALVKVFRHASKHPPAAKP